tara:strand:+ start:2857 stop:3330 length:474 start_codon:yes stop_codon:yes gene_type:complete
MMHRSKPHFRTPKGVLYDELPRYKYRVMSIARFDIEPENELDLGGKEGLQIRNYDGTIDLVKVTSRVVLLLPGYAWNGADWSSDKHFLDGSMVHDPLCQLMNTGQMSPHNHRRVTAIMAAENAKHGMSLFAQFKTRYAVNAHWTRKVKSMPWPAVQK